MSSSAFVQFTRLCFGQVSSLTGYATSYGFKAKIKPEAWAANCIADKHS